jgi:hypothetical protein
MPAFSHLLASFTFSELYSSSQFYHIVLHNRRINVEASFALSAVRVLLAAFALSVIMSEVVVVVSLSVYAVRCILTE